MCGMPSIGPGISRVPDKCSFVKFNQSFLAGYCKGSERDRDRDRELRPCPPANQCASSPQPLGFHRLQKSESQRDTGW